MQHPYQCIHTLFEQQVQATPLATALIYKDQQISYAELNRQSNQLAHYLQRHGVGPDVPVALYMERSPTLIITMLAILKAGGAYVPLDPLFPAQRISFMLQDCGAALLLTQTQLQADINSDISVILIDQHADQIDQEPATTPDSAVTANHLAYITYTSGSTGIPKGSEIPHRSIPGFMTDVKYITFDATQVFLQYSSVSWDAFTLELWPALIHGACCVLYPGQVPSLDELGAAIQQHQVSVLWLTASLFNSIIDSYPQTLQGVKYLMVGGEQLSITHIQKALHCLPDTQLINGYGPSECTVFTCCYPIPQTLPDHLEALPIGRPIGDRKVYVLDQQLNRTPIGVPGELYIGGPALLRGYLGRARLTAERLVPHPFTPEAGERLYRTGDIVRYLPNGTLQFLGRADRQVKLRGFRIELDELETVLRLCPDVREAVAVIREDTPGDRRLVAYVEAVPEAAPTPSELRRFLQTRLPDYMIPAIFMVLDRMPLTATGKINRTSLPAPDRTRTAEHSFVAATTPREKLLAEVWQAVLGLEQVGIHDNFFEVGGDSILSIQIVSRANQRGMPLSPKHIFQHQTIAELAALPIEATASSAEQGLVTGPVPLTPIQHWFFDQQLAAPDHWNQAMLFETHQPLDPTLLQQALAHVMQHHDALRMRFNSEEHQQYCSAEFEPLPFELLDATSVAAEQLADYLATAAQRLQTSLDLASGPLLRVAYINLGPERPGRLMIIIHHIVVDSVSWRIILEDLFLSYQQLLTNQPLQLAPKTSSFKQWAEQLVEYAQTKAVSQQAPYWLALAQTPTEPLPLDFSATHDQNSKASAQTLVVELPATETQALLQDVTRRFHVQIKEVLLTGLVLAYQNHTQQSKLLVNLEGHGREDLITHIDLARTVGWFTSLFPMLLDITNTATPEEALRAVKEQVRRVPHHGIGYGLLRYLHQDSTLAEPLALLQQPQISFNYLSQFRGPDKTTPTLLLVPAAESTGFAQSPHDLRQHLLDINGSIVDGQLRMVWTYSEHFHQHTTINHFANQFIEALRTLIHISHTNTTTTYTPSDFELAQLDQHQLDTIIQHRAKRIKKKT